MLKRKIIIGIILLIITALAVCLFVFYEFNDLNSISYEDYSFYQYFSGEKFEYTGTIEFNRDKDETSMSFDGDLYVNLDSTPIYYQDIEYKTLFAEDLSIVYPKSKVVYKITHFSSIENEEGTNYCVRDDDNIQLNSKAFIYDGGDLYFLLEDTIISFDDREIVLSAFSYLKVMYNVGVEIYDYEKDLYEIIETKSYIIATTDFYKINMSLDTMIVDETEQLLLKNFTELTEVK
ncbi:MAG: hypothetical protein R3Y21_01555 [Mycoplasmatota bacterium]